MENNNIIYINNKEYLSFDTMHETNYSLSNTTSQKHVEQGGWANDSKQRNPATIKINAGIGAGYNYNDKIDNAITLLTKLAKSKQLVDIVTTNQAYVNCSLDEFSHKNDADNIGLHLGKSC